MNRDQSTTASVLAHDFRRQRLFGPASFATGRYSERVTECIVCIGGLLVGLVFAGYLYGWGIVDVRNVGWLLNGGDMMNHFLGWDFFRRDHWQWPPGANPTFGYVVGNSIVFSDSLPLLAIPLKAIRAVLPDPFQYQGLILFGNCMLNGCFAALLAYRLGGRIGSALIVACLVVTGTIVTSRGYGGHGHDTLTAHWLILAAFILVWTRQTAGFERSRLSWVLLIAVSATIHFYLLVMVLVIWASELFSLGISEPRSCGMLIRHSLAVAASLFAVMYLVGYFSGVGTVPTAAGFGYFSANVLTFFNPHSTAWFFKSPTGVPSFSKFMPALSEFGDGQYEGQAYMGLGVLMMIGIGTCCWLLGKPLTFSRGARTLTAAAVLLALLSFSNVVCVGDREILNLHVAQPIATLLGVVRASGRFIWVLYYLLLFAAFLSIARSFPPKVTLACVICALLAQMADLAPWHAYLRSTAHHLPDIPEVARDADVYSFTARSERMIFLPVKDIPDNYGIFSFIAARHGMAVNATYSARTSEALLARANLDENHKLLSGAVTPDEVYVVSESTGLPEVVCKQRAMMCQRVNAQTVLIRARVK
jgi:hypothetical protein